MKNEFLVFGASVLTGGYFLKEIKDRGKEFHLFNRELMENESKENQTLYSSKNIPEFPEAKTLVICIGYPLDFLELILMPKEKKQISVSFQNASNKKIYREKIYWEINIWNIYHLCVFVYIITALSVIYISSRGQF